MEIILEVLLELLLEVLFAAVVGLFDSRTDPNLERAAVRLLGLALFGVGLGAVSTLVVPEHFLQAHTARLMWLGLAPLLGGALIAGFDALRRRGHPRPWRWPKFIGGAAFIGCLNATRFVMLGSG
jgi:peptidoglycan/LPS O-acetylase OafA/YrhL